MAYELRDPLEAYNSGSLTAIAGFHSLLTKGSQNKAQSIASLSHALAEPERIAGSLAHLSDPERAIMGRAAAPGRRGRTPPTAPRACPCRPGGSRSSHVQSARGQPARRRLSRRFDDVLARLPQPARASCPRPQTRRPPAAFRPAAPRPSAIFAA